MAVAAVINCKLNESLQIDLCTQSIQQKKEKRRWHLKGKIHQKDNKEGSWAPCAMAAASAAAQMLPVYFNSCSQNDRVAVGGGRGCMVDRLGA